MQFFAYVSLEHILGLPFRSQRRIRPSQLVNKENQEVRRLISGGFEFGDWPGLERGFPISFDQSLSRTTFLRLLRLTAI